MSDSNQNSFIDFIKGLSIPDLIKRNAITALAKGVGKLITSGMNVPAAYLDQQTQLIEAKTEAKVKIINAASDAASLLFSIPDNELAERALTHFSKKLIEQQYNREQVVAKTTVCLSEIEKGQIANREIDEDWLTQFWNISESKSKEDVQDILARILTKEIIKPGSISPYTLQLLSVLTSDIGGAFQRLSNISIDDGTTCFVIHPSAYSFMNIGPLDNFSISFEDLLDLDGVGLIRSAETLMLNYASSPIVNEEDVNYAGSPAKLNLAGTQVNVIQFTKAGRELRNLLHLVEHEAFTAKLKEKYPQVIKTLGFI